MSALVVIAALAGGAVGAVIRYGISRAFRGTPSWQPWAVLVANVVGSAIAGVVFELSSWSAVAAIGPELRLVLIGGLAGGLTTFSTFSVETIQLIHSGRTRVAVALVALNVVLALAVMLLAAWVTHTFEPAPWDG